MTSSGSGNGTPKRRAGPGRSFPRLTFLLVLAATALGAADLFHHKHAAFEVERLPAFHGIYAFLVAAALLLLAQLLRRLLKRPEDFYGRYAVDTESHPPEQLRTEEHDD